MKSIVLYSPNDAELLVRAYERLKKEGVSDIDKCWNERHNPISGKKQWAKEEGRTVWYYALVIDKGGFAFANHDCQPTDIQITLTHENFEQSIQTVLKERQ